MEVLLDTLLSDQIGLKTLKTGIDVLLPDNCKEDDLAYF